MRVCLIFNPRAGTADRIKDLLLQLTGDHRCELRATTQPGDARRVAGEAVEEGVERIIAAGGDGTISEVVNGIAPHFSSVELAILPFGTGNDLARSIGIRPDQLESACRGAFGDRVEQVDVVRVVAQESTSYFANVANGGFGGRVAADVQWADKQRWGPLAYWMTTVSRLVDLQAYQIEMALDDEVVTMETYGVAVANGRFVGGGFPIAPRAMLNDGLLDVTTIPVLPPLELMAAGVNFTLGRNHRDDRVRSYRARRVRISSTPDMPFSMDGEPTRQMDATFEVIPKALSLVVGEQAPGLGGEPTRMTWHEP